MQIITIINRAHNPRLNQLLTVAWQVISHSNKEARQKTKVEEILVTFDLAIGV